MVNDKGKFILNLLPSGILRGEVTNVMGNGMVIDLEHLAGEMGRLRDAGIEVGPQHLKISDKAVICLPYHRQQDCLEEERLGMPGTAPPAGESPPFMGTIYEEGHPDGRAAGAGSPQGAAAGDCGVEEPHLYWRLPCPAHRFCGGVGLAGDLRRSPAPLYLRYLPLSGRGGQGWQEDPLRGQLGALRDIDFGIYPYTSSSSTIGAYAP